MHQPRPILALFHKTDLSARNHYPYFYFSPILSLIKIDLFTAASLLSVSTTASLHRVAQLVLAQKVTVCRTHYNSFAGRSRQERGSTPVLAAEAPGSDRAQPGEQVRRGRGGSLSGAEKTRAFVQIRNNA